MVNTQDAQEPAVGSTVRLLPVARGAERSGTLAEWSAGPAGIVVTARLDVSAQDAAALAGERVWARLQVGGGVRVLEAVAAPGVVRTELELTGVLSLAAETRRAEPRVPTQRRAQLRARAAVAAAKDDALAAHTVDLSRSGARLGLPAGQVLPDDSTLQVTLEVDGEDAVSLTAHVVRTDPATHEVAVRFVDLVEADAQRIDRVVLAELSEQAGQPAERG